ncbi:MAG: hypothetical protein KDE55_22105 [Novosphingobium sp.]|nr:hypothetical protein [Novosphingobium sp.]
MRKVLVFAGALTLAACNQPAAEAPAEEAATEEAATTEAPEAADGAETEADVTATSAPASIAGNYDLESQNIKVTREFTSDGNIVTKFDDGRVVEGKYTYDGPGKKLCFDGAEGDACDTITAMEADGSFTTEKGGLTASYKPKS